MEQEIRFCITDDGVRIAYATAGSGPPLIWCYSWVTHLQMEWDNPDSRAFLERLAQRHLLVRYDKRGVGLSDRDVSDISREARVRDLAAVVNTLGLETFALAGQSESGPVAITYAARHPERVNALILYGAAHRSTTPPAVLDPLIALIRQQWGMGSAALTSVFARSGNPSQTAFFMEMQRIGASKHMAAALLEANKDLDITPVLADVKVPTLVLHRRKDGASPVEVAREMAALIPNARFVQLEGEIHPPYWGDTEPILSAIEHFLGTEATSASPPASGVRTVLFTDLVGHTEMMQRLGDERGRALLREHERVTREVLKRHGGTEIKTLGDGFMASFGSVASATQCAVGLQRAFDERNAGTSEPLRVRVGLNAGEPIEEDGDLFGAAVIMASRIAAAAGEGEILIAEPVRHLLAGKGFVFADRGEIALKGFEDRLRLFEVVWRT